MSCDILFYICGMDRPKKLNVYVTLTGKALEMVLDEKEQYEKRRIQIKKSEIINRLLEGREDKRLK